MLNPYKEIHFIGNLALFWVCFHGLTIDACSRDVAATVQIHLTLQEPMQLQCNSNASLLCC